MPSGETVTDHARSSALPMVQSSRAAFAMQPSAPAFWVRVPLVARSKTATALLLMEAT